MKKSKFDAPKGAGEDDTAFVLSAVAAGLPPPVTVALLMRGSGAPGSGVTLIVIVSVSSGFNASGNLQLTDATLHRKPRGAPDPDHRNSIDSACTSGGSMSASTISPLVARLPAFVTRTRYELGSPSTVKLVGVANDSIVRPEAGALQTSSTPRARRTGMDRLNMLLSPPV